MPVLIAEMILAELACNVAVGFEQARDIRILYLHAEVRTRQANFGQPGPIYALPRNVRRSARSAALFAVVVGEHHAFPGDSVDVGRSVTHQSECVGADIGLTDIITPDDQHVWFILRQCGLGNRKAYEYCNESS